MIDTDLESYVREIVFKTLKEVGICPTNPQTTLTPNDVQIGAELEEYMQDKQCLIWLGSTEKGREQNVKCNQFYQSHYHLKKYSIYGKHTSKAIVLKTSILL